MCSPAAKTGLLDVIGSEHVLSTNGKAVRHIEINNEGEA